MLNKLPNLLYSDLGPFKPLLTSLVAMLVFFVLRRWALSALAKTIDEPTRRYTLSKLTSYGLAFLTLIVIAQSWVSERLDVGTWLGLLSAGLAIAFRDPLVNLAAWLFLLVRQPFKIGDRIEIGDIAGDVVDIAPLTFSLLEIGNWVRDDQSTGRIVHVPNGKVFHRPVASYTHGFDFIWNELDVTVTFESDWAKARDLLTEIIWRQSEKSRELAAEQIAKTSQKYVIHYKHLTPIVWVAVVDHGVCLSVRYLCPARLRRKSANDIWVDILNSFNAEESIDFAYPTQRFYQIPPLNPVDAKSPSIPPVLAGPTSPKP